MDLVVPDGGGREALLELARRRGWDQAKLDQFLREEQEADEESRRYEEYLELIQQATEDITLSPADLARVLSDLAIDPAMLQETQEAESTLSPRPTSGVRPPPMSEEEFRRAILGPTAEPPTA